MRSLSRRGVLGLGRAIIGGLAVGAMPAAPAPARAAPALVTSTTRGPAECSTAARSAQDPDTELFTCIGAGVRPGSIYDGRWC